MRVKRAPVRSTAIAAEIEKLQQMEQSERQLQESYHSLSQHLKMHRQCRDEALEPLEGSIIHALWRKGQLTRQQLIAWHRWHADMMRAIGKTDKLTIGYRERADGGGDNQASYYGPGTYWSAEVSKIEEVNRLLRSHEKGLIEQLFRDYLRAAGMKEMHAHNLGYLGKFLSGYTDKSQSIAAAVASIQRLLQSLSEIYRIEHFYY